MSRNKKYSYIQPGKMLWMSSVLLMPVEVEIIEAYPDKRKAKVKTKYQDGEVNFEDIYETELEADKR
jgi:hypothetical protein